MINLVEIVDKQGLIFYNFNPQNLNFIEILNFNLANSAGNSLGFKAKIFQKYLICVARDVGDAGDGREDDEEFMGIYEIVTKFIERKDITLRPLELDGSSPSGSSPSSIDGGYGAELDTLLLAHIHSQIIKPTKQVMKFTKKTKKSKQKQDSTDAGLDFSPRESIAQPKIETGQGFDNNQVKDLAYTKKTSLFSFNIKITESSLEKPLETLLSHLVSKNIASQVAKELITKLRTSLLQDSRTILHPLNTLIQSHLKLLLSQTLSLSTNLLHDIQQSPNLYTICFVGVNGVGKSTNLSKLAYFLISNNLKVLIVACDTFRSGAVEQLKIHARNLDLLKPGLIEVYDRGYGKDPSGICKLGIEYAKGNGFDVVLVDTAGRMQDNTPLLKALAKVSCV
jgi:signal recognition particle GTPase